MQVPPRRLCDTRTSVGCCAHNALVSENSTFAAVQRKHTTRYHRISFLQKLVRPLTLVIYVRHIRGFGAADAQTTEASSVIASDTHCGLGRQAACVNSQNVDLSVVGIHTIQCADTKS